MRQQTTSRVLLFRFPHSEFSGFRFDFLVAELRFAHFLMGLGFGERFLRLGHDGSLVEDSFAYKSFAGFVERFDKLFQFFIEFFQFKIPMVHLDAEAEAESPAN